MNKLRTGIVVVCAMAIALSILTPVLGREEHGTTGKQRKKEQSDEKLIRVHAKDKEGNKKLELIANRDEALPIIFVAYESFSSWYLESNVIKALLHYKGTKYEKRIMAFLKGEFLDNPSSRKRGELLMLGLCLNSRHPITKFMIAKSAETEGEDRADKRLRNLVRVMREYFDTGDEGLLEKWRLSAEWLRPPGEGDGSENQGKDGK
jgi:hypothetical protein